MAIAVFSKSNSWKSKQLSLTFILVCIFNISAGSAFAVQRTTFTITQVPSLSTASTSILEDRVEILEQEIKRLEEKEPKDAWDKLNAISGLISGGLVAAIGIVATYLYNERQRKNAEAQKQREIAVMQVQTVQSFMPQLRSEEPKEIEAALLAITALGNAQLATELATIYRTEGAISALSKIASSSNRTISEQAEKSLEELFNPLTETVALVGSKDKSRGGCGFFVSRDGLLVTPKFVIADLEEIVVSFKNVDYEAHLISKQNNEDEALVLLKIEDAGFPTLPILEKVEIKPGEDVFTLGRNWRKASWSFSSGMVEGYTIESSSNLFCVGLLP